MNDSYEDIQKLMTRWQLWQHLPDDVRAKLPRGRIWVSGTIDTQTRLISALRVMPDQPYQANAVKMRETLILPVLNGALTLQRDF